MQGGAGEWAVAVAESLVGIVWIPQAAAGEIDPAFSASLT